MTKSCATKFEAEIKYHFHQHVTHLSASVSCASPLARTGQRPSLSLLFYDTHTTHISSPPLLSLVNGVVSDWQILRKCDGAMSSQRYERVGDDAEQTPRLLVSLADRRTPSDHLTTADMASSQIATHDTDDHDTALSPIAIPNSPPPSFRSRNSSHRVSREDEDESEQERNLNNAFDAPSDDESDDEGPRDQQRLIPADRASSRSLSSNETSDSSASRHSAPERTITNIPVFAPSAATTSDGRTVFGGGNNDGVFANLNAKPRAGDDVDEKPPTYEQAAADATPPYWETTVLSPYHSTGNPDDVFVDGLLVGSLFSFVWNALISMSFQLIGFLLTYLLHTTHAAKHGSRAGLGITLVQYGFQMRYAASQGPMDGGPGPTDGVPEDPNAHNFDPNQVGGGGGDRIAGISTSDWLSYVLMIVGWFILIRAISDYMRARRQEALVRSSPDRGLGVAVVAEGENPESSV